MYTRSKEEIEQALQKVSQMNSTIVEQWKGQAFQAYLEQYNQLSESVKKFEELLVNINEQLNKYADTIAERDAQDAQSFGFSQLPVRRRLGTARSAQAVARAVN